MKFFFIISVVLLCVCASTAPKLLIKPVRGPDYSYFIENYEEANQWANNAFAIGRASDTLLHVLDTALPLNSIGPESFAVSCGKGMNVYFGVYNRLANKYEVKSSWIISNDGKKERISIDLLPDTLVPYPRSINTCLGGINETERRYGWRFHHVVFRMSDRRMKVAIVPSPGDGAFVLGVVRQWILDAT
jgi:hypothetical protein